MRIQNLVGVAAALLATTSTFAVADDQAAVTPGSVVRWPGAGVTACVLGDSAWPPIGNTCWYPIDLETRPDTITLRRVRGGDTEQITVRVRPYPYPQQAIAVEPDMAHPPDHLLERIRLEQQQVAELWERDGPVGFELPLAPPLEPLPDPRSFGARRVINGEPRSPHSGVDLSGATGTPVFAAACGEVALSSELYFSGKSVILDHGDRLFTMYFHLSEILVQDGDRVQRGQLIGRIGATGRVTGPHLHFGVRWHDARIDPVPLLGETVDVPSIGAPVVR